MEKWNKNKENIMRFDKKQQKKREQRMQLGDFVLVDDGKNKKLITYYEMFL